MKRLTAELNMAESAQQAQDMDIHRLANELQVLSTHANRHANENEPFLNLFQEIKQKYLQAKKRERVNEEREFQNRPKIQPNVVDGPRFTGGGFNLSKVAA